MQLALRENSPEPDNTVASKHQTSIFAQLWQQRVAVAATFSLALIAFIALISILPVTYFASGSVIVADREPLSSSASSAWVQKIGDPADMESTILLMRSPRLMRLLLNDPDLGEAAMADCEATARQILARLRPINCTRLSKDPDAQLLWIQDRFTVSAVGRSRVISVGYKSALPEAAQVFVNALIRTFLDDERSKMLRSRDDATEWVRSRLQQVDAELRHDETAIEEFRNRNGLVRGINGLLSAERLTQAGQQLSEAKAAEADAVLRMQEAQGGAGSRQVLESRPISDLKQQLVSVRAEAANAAQRLGQRNPKMAALRQQEADLAAQLSAETARVFDAARRNLAAARVRVTTAQRELADRTDAANQAAEAETQIASMVRELEIKRGIFVDLSQRLSQLETERRLLASTTQLVSWAELPTRPAFPQKLPFLLGGATLASVLAGCVGLILYKPEKHSRALAVNQTYTRIPILANVPELRLARDGKKDLLGRKRELSIKSAIALLDSHPPLLEAVRILHARLALAGFGTLRRTLMVASEGEAEGKTFIAVALARLARASGRRVLVIEAGLRRPQLEDMFAGPPSPGLGGYLVGGPIDVVQLQSVPGVDFVLAGDPVTTSTELLSGPRFAELLAWATCYDVVIVDTPPIGMLMDAPLLAPHMDGVLFCVRHGRPMLEGALNSIPQLQRDNGNVVGMVMTFVPANQASITQIASKPKAQLARAMQPGHS